MGLQEALFPPREQEIAQGGGVIVAVNVGSLDRLEHHEFIRRQRDRQFRELDDEQETALTAIGFLRDTNADGPARPI